jgi:hypothetical protein
MEKPVSVTATNPPQNLTVLDKEPKKILSSVKQTSKTISDSTLTLSKKEEKNLSTLKTSMSKAEKESSDIDEESPLPEKKNLKRKISTKDNEDTSKITDKKKKRPKMLKNLVFYFLD